MLAAPFKRTTQTAWVAPLRDYLQKKYPSAEAEAHYPSVQKLATLRTRVQGVSSTIDRSSVEACEQYLVYLAAIQPRFPIGESISVSFTWHDSLKPKKKITQSSVSYERACVMYNLAALESHKAMHLDRAEIESLKEMKKGFTRAASILHYLRETLVSQIPGPVTPDLSNEGLGMMYNIMAAQSQACFYEFALRSHSKPSILAVLAAAASNYYSQAMSLAEVPTLSSVIDRSWKDHIEFQQKSFASTAEYQYAKACHLKADKEGSGYGEEVARLARARELCKEAIESGRNSKALPDLMLRSLGHLFDKIQHDEIRAREDNNNIYVESIPTTLTPIPKRDAVKIVDLEDEITDASLKDKGPNSPFRKLLPPAMQQAEAKYQSALSKLLEDSAGKVQSHAEELRVRLAEAGLPAAVEAGDGTTKGLPEAVWQRVVEGVQSKGGVSALFARLNENETIAQNVVNTLNRIEAKLRTEEDADAVERNKFGPIWEMKPSKEASEHMRQDVERYRKLIQEARNADRLVSTKVDQNMEILSRTQLSKQELDNMIPNPQQLDDNPEIEKLRSELSILLVELGSKVQEAEILQTQLATICDEDTIVADLLESPLGAEIAAKDETILSQIISKNLAKHNEMTGDIALKVENLYPMLSRILDKNHMYAQIRTQSDVSRRREALVGEMNAAITVFEELNSHVDQGGSFWNDISFRCTELARTVDDHCFARDLQRKEESHRIEQEQRSRLEQVAPQRAPMNRDLSMPSISAYTVGDAAVESSDVPVEYPAAVIEGGQSTPSSRYPASGGATEGEAAPQDTSQSQENAKMHQLRELVGSAVTDERLQQLLDGAGDNVEVAANHYFSNPAAGSASSAAPSRSTKRSSKRSSKSGGLFSRFKK